MAKPPRSPLLGYNHNVKYGGHIFHVQTEDSGPGNPHLFTHLFFEGSILASKRGQYDPGLPEDEVRSMMQAQHKAILKELKQASFDERITRFFEMRGETFRADEFFTGRVDVPEPIATPSPVPMAPTEAPAPVEVLDLDALPATPTERAHTPEPLPIHVTKPAVPGPGTYTFRRPTREHFSSDPAPPAAPKPQPAATVRPVGARPVTPVVVQRQVIVGAGAPATSSVRKPTTTPVRRRPVSGGPYVVKQGSHANIAGNLAESFSGQRAEPPPRPVAPTKDAAQAPRTTAEPKRSPTQEGAPSVFVTDQSLDDVILAYLSQGERKR
jgi:hypothetical protein